MRQAIDRLKALIRLHAAGGAVGALKTIEQIGRMSTRGHMSQRLSGTAQVEALLVQHRGRLPLRAARGHGLQRTDRKAGNRDCYVGVRTAAPSAARQLARPDDRIALARVPPTGWVQARWVQAVHRFGRVFVDFADFAFMVVCARLRLNLGTSAAVEKCRLATDHRETHRDEQP